MKLTTDYLAKRHRYWMGKIADAGIWDASKFGPVTFEIHPYSKCYYALFYRKVINHKPVDIIIIYRQYHKMSLRDVDNIIVHEMIHQYIIQNDLPDSSIHGTLFKNYMSTINEAFPKKLKIDISSERPIIKGASDRKFTIMVIKFSDKYVFCNVRPSKIQYFTDYASRKGWKYMWGESDDLYFERLNLCTKKLQGYAIKPEEIKSFIAEYRIHPINK